MNKMFETFMQKVKEEEERRAKAKQEYDKRQKQGPFGYANNSKFQYQHSQYYDSEDQRSYKDGPGYYGNHFQQANQHQTYQQQYEKAKNDERQQRAAEYERIKREEYETQQRMKEKAEKAARAFSKGAETAKKDGIIGGIVAGFKEWFK